MYLTKEELEMVYKDTGLKSDRIHISVAEGFNPGDKEERKIIMNEVLRAMKAIANGDYKEIKHMDRGMPQLHSDDWRAKNWKYRLWVVHTWLWEKFLRKLLND